MNKLIKSDEVPGDKKFLKNVFKKADKGDGKKDGKVKFDSLLESFTKALEDEAEDEAEEEVDSSEEPESDVSEQEGEVDEEDDDSNPRCFIDPVFAKNEIKQIPDIQYGSADIKNGKQQQDLMLDAYLPPDSD